MRIANVLAGHLARRSRRAPKGGGQEGRGADQAGARTKFTEQAVALGHHKRLVDDLAGQIETFGRYGFNKSHSVAYSVLSYQTAWLKTHYPAEFMAALLSSEIGNTDRVVQVHQRGARAGHRGAAARRQRVRLQVHGRRRPKAPLRARRDPQRGLGRDRLDHRAPGRTRRSPMLCDFIERIDLRLCNKRVFEALIAAGALDSLGGHRAQIVAALDSALAEAQLLQQERRGGPGLALRRGDRERTPRRDPGGAPGRPALDRGRAPRQGEGDPRLLHLRASARALPRRGRALRHPHHGDAGRVERAPGEHRRGGDRR